MRDDKSVHANNESFVPAERGECIEYSVALNAVRHRSGDDKSMHADSESFVPCRAALNAVRHRSMEPIHARDDKSMHAADACGECRPMSTGVCGKELVNGPWPAKCAAG